MRGGWPEPSHWGAEAGPNRCQSIPYHRAQPTPAAGIDRANECCGWEAGERTTVGTAAGRPTEAKEQERRGRGVRPPQGTRPGVGAQREQLQLHRRERSAWAGPGGSLGRPIYRAQSAPAPPILALPASHRAHPVRLRPFLRGPGWQPEHQGPPRAHCRRFSFKSNSLAAGRWLCPGTRPEPGWEWEARGARLRTAVPRNACREPWFQCRLSAGRFLARSSNGALKAWRNGANEVGPRLVRGPTPPACP